MVVKEPKFPELELSQTGQALIKLLDDDHKPEGLRDYKSHKPNPVSLKQIMDAFSQLNEAANKKGYDAREVFERMFTEDDQGKMHLDTSDDAVQAIKGSIANKWESVNRRLHIAQQIGLSYDDLEKFSEVVGAKIVRGKEQPKQLWEEISDRMPAKVSSHYAAIAEHSDPVKNLVKPREEHIVDLTGESDPSNQAKYMPTDGVIHKYDDIALVFVIQTCDSHCTYCYRLDVLSDAEDKAEEKRPVKPEDAAAFIKWHNDKVAHEGVWDEEKGVRVNPDNNKPALREVLLSGGDALVPGNNKLMKWLVNLAEAGVESIRFGTKELAFYPERVDEAFARTIEKFQKHYPQVNLSASVHFTHPDEFLKKDKNGNYIPIKDQGDDVKFEWIEKTKEAVDRLRDLGFTLNNQTPIIQEINKDADAIALLQKELKANGVEGHYFFIGRPIKGYKAHSITMEEAVEVFNESQAQLSGIEQHAKLAMSTEWGKWEVQGIKDYSKDKGASQEDQAKVKVVQFKILRAPDGFEHGATIEARIDPERTKEIHWVTDFGPEDIVYDGSGGKIREVLRQHWQEQETSSERPDVPLSRITSRPPEGDIENPPIPEAPPVPSDVDPEAREQGQGTPQKGNGGREDR